MRTVLRDGWRSLTRDGVFSTTVLLLLSITIGTVLAVYAMVDALVLRPLPFRDQDRVFLAWQRDDRRALPVVEVALGEMRDWSARARAFEKMAVVGSVNWSLRLVGRTESESIPLAAVSPSFFDVTGVPPSLGRALLAADDEGVVPRAMVISHGLWVRRFGSDRSVIGRAVPVNLDAGTAAVPIEIAGVMPAGFDFPRGADAWVPAAPLIRRSVARPEDLDAALRWLRVFFVVARSREGVSLGDATRDLTAVMRSADSAGGPEANQAVVVTPVRDYLLGPARPMLWTLLAGAVLMLAGACANVAGLQLARQARRQRALAVRVALGASHRALALQACIESALLTAAGVVCALPVAAAIARGLIALAPADVPRLDTVAVFEIRVLFAAAALTFATVALTGLWPAMAASRVDAVAVLAHGSGSTPRARWIGRSIVVGQVAVAVVLLAGTALFIRSLAAMNRAALGFTADRLVSFTVTPRTDDLDQWNAAFERLESRVAALPGVVRAGAVQLRPLSGPVGWESQPLLPGQVPSIPATWGLNPMMNLQTVSPGYFATMGIRLVRGRLFTAQDDRNSPGVVVVSESTARRLWPGRDPLGQRLVHDSYRADVKPGEIRWQTVIGVVEDVRYRGLLDVRLDCYMPVRQSRGRVTELMVRAGEEPAALVRSVRAAAAGHDLGVSVSDATIMAEVVARESAPWRFLARMFVGFAAVAGVLAAVGLGTVVALSVASRRRELAIRAALGADRARLRRVVLREGAGLAALGVLGGLAGAVALGRGVAHLLVGVAPHDWLSLSAAAALCVALALAASWWPARRAAATDPAEALKAE